MQEQRHVFTPAAYSLFDNNCNDFSDALSTFLTGSGIPVSIVCLASTGCSPACSGL